MSDLARLLEPRFEDTLQRWTDALAPTALSVAPLREHLTPLLVDLVTALRQGTVTLLRAPHPDIQLHASTGSLARSLELLAGVLLERADQAGVSLTTTDARVLARFVASAADAVAERRLVSDAGQEALLAQTQEARREANRERRKQHELFMQTPIAITIVEGPEHICVFANSFYLDLTHHRDVVGKRLLDAVPELQGTGLDQILDRVRSTGVVVHRKEVPVRFHHHLGAEQLLLNFVYTPTHNHRGEIDGVMMCGWDVTEQVTARRRTEEAIRMRDVFLDTINHELRPPLTAMLGWVQMLRTHSLPADQNDRALETIERNARAQAQLIDDLLDMGRFLTDTFHLEAAPLDLVPLVEAALDAVRPAAEAKDIRLQASLAPAAVVMGDADRLQEVVEKLLSNAVKFTPRGGRVQVLVQCLPSWVELLVADSGQGIAPEFLPHIFERFRHSDDASARAQGGIGLGLSMVQPLIERHGGRVSVASEGLGKGATFTVRLPVAATRRHERTPAGPSAGASAAETRPLEGLSLLVVDDDDDTREMLRWQFEAQGARVRLGESAAEGMELFTAERPDLLVSDIGMPITSGYTFIGMIRALPAAIGGDVPAIALTAYARSEDRAQALAAGFNAHLTKPVEPRELITTVTALARRPRPGQG